MDFPEIKTWGFGPWLTRATADYYLTVDTYLTLEQNGDHGAPLAESEWQSHAAEMAEGIAKYLIMACAGEMRHSTQLQVWAASTKHHYSRHQIWEQAFDGLRDKDNDWLALVTAGWAEQFVDKGQFAGSVGGKMWGQAAALTSQYLSNDLTPVMFVEFALNLHHNCARIFNKLPLPSAFMAVLDAGFAGITNAQNEPMAIASVVLKQASMGRREAWAKSHGMTETEITLVAGAATPTVTPQPGAPVTAHHPKAKVLGSSQYSPSTPDRLW